MSRARVTRVARVARSSCSSHSRPGLSLFSKSICPSYLILDLVTSIANNLSSSPSSPVLKPASSSGCSLTQRGYVIEFLTLAKLAVKGQNMSSLKYQVLSNSDLKKS